MSDAVYRKKPSRFWCFNKTIFSPAIDIARDELNRVESKIFASDWMEICAFYF
jgi:hypothetical protein